MYRWQWHNLVCILRNVISTRSAVLFLLVCFCSRCRIAFFRSVRCWWGREMNRCRNAPLKRRRQWMKWKHSSKFLLWWKFTTWSNFDRIFESIFETKLLQVFGHLAKTESHFSPGVGPWDCGCDCRCSFSSRSRIWKSLWEGQDTWWQFRDQFIKGTFSQVGKAELWSICSPPAHVRREVETR